MDELLGIFFVVFELIAMSIDFGNELPVVEVWHFRDSKDLNKQKKYIKSDGFDILEEECFLELFKIHFVVHVIPGHHDDFIGGYRVGIVMID